RCIKCPRKESNLRTGFRKPALYPLSYGGGNRKGTQATVYPRVEGVWGYPRAGKAFLTRGETRVAARRAPPAAPTACGSDAEPGGAGRTDLGADRGLVAASARPSFAPRFE